MVECFIYPLRALMALVMRYACRAMWQGHVGGLYWLTSSVRKKAQHMEPTFVTLVVSPDHS
jgi:hypothetical protein